MSVKCWVRLPGETQWKNETWAEPGGIVELSIEFRNTGYGRAPEVQVYVEGPASGWVPQPMTGYLKNSNYPDGKVMLGQTGDGTSLFTTGWGIGSYSSGSNTFVGYVCAFPGEAPVTSDEFTSLEAGGRVVYSPRATAWCTASGDGVGSGKIIVQY